MNGRSSPQFLRRIGLGQRRQFSYDKAVTTSFRALRLRDVACWRPGPVTAAAVGLAATAAATVLRIALEPYGLQGYSFVTFFISTIAAAALGGWVAGGTALVSALLVAWWLFIPPAYSFDLNSRRDLIALPVFLVNAGLSAAVAAGMKGALARLCVEQARREFLAAETGRRARELLETVRALSDQTAGASLSVKEYRANLSDRLSALEASDAVLSRGHHARADLRAVIEAAAALSADGRVVLTPGPRVDLSPEAATNLGLLFHELTTNALKHGALRCEEGRVSVRWERRGDALGLEWRETGGERPAARLRKGYGARLIESVTAELDAFHDSRLTDAGFAARRVIPVSDHLRIATVPTAAAFVSAPERAHG